MRSYNIRIKGALDDELNNLEVDMGAFNESEATIEEAKRAVTKVKATTKDLENYLYDYFEK